MCPGDFVVVTDDRERIRERIPMPVRRLHVRLGHGRLAQQLAIDPAAQAASCPAARPSVDAKGQTHHATHQAYSPTSAFTASGRRLAATMPTVPSTRPIDVRPYRRMSIACSGARSQVLGVGTHTSLRIRAACARADRDLARSLCTTTLPGGCCDQCHCFRGGRASVSPAQRYVDGLPCSERPALEEHSLVGFVTLQLSINSADRMESATVTAKMCARLCSGLIMLRASSPV